MATLKTGLPYTVRSYIGVDPDTPTVIKDFASALVTADMTIESGVTIGSRTRNGQTRHYIALGGSGFDPTGILMGTNKPAIPNGPGTGEAVTILIFGKVGSGNAVQFFFEGSHWRIGRDGGSGRPCAQAWGANLGTAAIPNDGSTAYGIATRFNNSGTCTHYYGIETGADAFELLANGTWTDGNTGSDTGNLTFLGGAPGQGFIVNDLHAFIHITGAGITQGHIDAIYADPETALLNMAAGGASASRMTLLGAG